MKRKPEKNYKLPKYAAGLAAVLFAGGMTGCTDPTDSEVQLSGDIEMPQDTEVVQLDGDVAFVEDTTQNITEKSTEEVMLVGDVAPAETCMIETSTAETTEEPLQTDGEVEFDLGDPQTVPMPAQELVIAGDLVME